MNFMESGPGSSDSWLVPNKKQTNKFFFFFFLNQWYFYSHTSILIFENIKWWGRHNAKKNPIILKTIFNLILI